MHLQITGRPTATTDHSSSREPYYHLTRHGLDGVSPTLTMTESTTNSAIHAGTSVETRPDGRPTESNPVNISTHHSGRVKKSSTWKGDTVSHSAKTKSMVSAILRQKR